MTISENAPIKRLRSINHPVTETVDDLQHTTIVAYRFTATRFPFLLFFVLFSKDVHEETVINGLTEYASEKLNFRLKLVAYECGCTENNERRMLIFVENGKFFVFMYNHENFGLLLWPARSSQQRNHLFRRNWL